MATDLNHTTTPRRTPIFILGILPRSGTNFLFDLLQLHPECGRTPPIWEDYFVRHIDQLVHYLEDVSSHWSPRKGVDAEVIESVFHTFGEAIMSFLASRNPTHRIVIKTPRVDNLAEFPRFFPEAPLLIIVRDGRAVVESGVNTFGWRHEWAMREWTRAGKIIRAFDEQHCGGNSSYLIVRYEDLWGSLETEIVRILDFLNLDTSCYDLDAARNLPIRGSSTLSESGAKEVHWKPMEKNAAFDPMSRWRHWGRMRHERFNWLAGDTMVALGYTLQKSGVSRGTAAFLNRVLDLRRAIMAVGGALITGASQKRKSVR